MAVVSTLDLGLTPLPLMHGSDLVPDAAGPMDSIELDEGVAEGFDVRRFPHVLCSVRMFSDAAGTVPIVDSTGVFTVAVKSVAKQYEPPIETTIDATAPDTISWRGPTFGYRVVVSTPLTDAITWRAILTVYR